MLIQDVVIGALKVNGIPERECIKSWAEAVESLTRVLNVEIPREIAGVLLQSQEPSEDQRDKLWVRLDTSGQPLGLYLFQNSNWKPFYNVPPGEVFWFTGSSATPPEGFTVIEVGDPDIPANVVSGLRAQFIPDLAGNFAYFAAKFTGF